MISLWRGRPTLAAIDAAYAEFLALSERQPGGVVVFSTSSGSYPSMGPDERKRSVATLSDVRDRLLALSVTIEGEGFIAGASRSILTGITLLARPRCPIKVFNQRAEAAAWLAPFVRSARGAPVTAADLRAAVEQVQTAEVPAKGNLTARARGA